MEHTGSAKLLTVVDTPEPSGEALVQLMIAVMKLSINLMLLCGVPC
jgi:hypothetical protein